MSIDAQIDNARRRLVKVLPVVAPPKLSLNIFSEKEWNNKKPTDQSQWELNLKINGH